MINGDFKKWEWLWLINVYCYKSLVIILNKKNFRWNWNEFWWMMYNNVEKFWLIYIKLMIVYLKLINNNCMYIFFYWVWILV